MNNEFKSVSVLGVEVFSDDLQKIPIQGYRCRVINCSMSPNSYGLAVKDKEFNEVLHETDYLMLDGVYFAMAPLLLLGKNIKKNQGPDVYKHFISRINATNGKVFFLGSTEHVLEKIRQRIKIEYPNVIIETYSPPFKKEFSESDNLEMISKINEFAPNVLFVGMTCPKQEKWAVKHRDYLNSNLIISIGNVFDWYAGTQKPIHPFFFKIRMAWLVRMIVRPEIIKRNLGNQMIFVWHVILMFLKLKKPVIESKD